MARATHIAPEKMSAEELAAERRKLEALISQRGAAASEVLREKMQGLFSDLEIRPVVENDLRPGVEILVLAGDPIDLSEGGRLRAFRRIRLDDVCCDSRTVYFHCIGEKCSTLQCHAPKALVLGGLKEMLAPFCLLFVISTTS